ncbi:thymidylate kinase [Candidatus Pacearchaeota archaeon]|nr:thymidylate kinase [Candidatus Pacearchaeota archaeon]
MYKKQKGKIIVLEGTDKSGKGTQTKLLIDRLREENIPCESMSFPNYDTASGRIIGQCLLGKERDEWSGDSNWFGDPDKVNAKIASLYYAADRLKAKPEIEEIINSGINLILDRYVESNMGHQAGKIKNKKKKLEIIDYISNLEYNLNKLPKPDGIVFLHMPHKLAMKLGKKMEEKLDGHESNKGHLRRAEKTYQFLAQNYEWKTIECALGNSIDSIKSPNDIHEEVYTYIIKIFNHNNI